ncbi:hypothetical protein [Arthrobacter citreus]|uniref:hypothetical protein n=1 Tax=Arthrobacter citreus TaxID=1670 RepID=UPI0036DAA213
MRTTTILVEGESGRQALQVLAGRPGNKIRCAPLLVGALTPANVPEPLARLVAAFPATAG